MKARCVSLLCSWLAAGLVALAYGAATAGAVPAGSAFTYQGRLDFGGSAVSNTCDFQFRLWDDPLAVDHANQVGPTLVFDGQGGNPPPIVVANGLFTVQLDFGPDAFDGTALWMEIAVRCPPDGAFITLDPRQPIAAAPYALFALSGPGTAPALRAQIRGDWLLEDGELLPDFDAFLAVTAIRLSDDGKGRIFFRDTFTNAKDCVRLLHLFDGETLVIDFSPEPASFNHPQQTFAFPMVVIEGDSLTLADEEGHIARFTRQQELPASVVCGSLQVVDTFDNVPAPSFFTGLVEWIGDLLYNSTANQIERFDLDTDTVGPVVAPTDGRLLQSVQNLNFWTHCACGGSPDATFRTLASVIDTVRTGTDLGLQITIRAMEYVPTTNRLWLAGRAASDSRGRFLIVNTSGEPDILEEAILFDREVRGLSFDGADLWAVVTMRSRSICRIDPSTRKVLESFELPDEDGNLYGLRFAGGYLYAIGVNAESQGVLYRLEQP